MLVDFRVKNFRSLRDEQELSLVASTDKAQLDTHTIPTGIKAIPNILRSAVIYGANASGKSNIIRAIQYIRNMVVEAGINMRPDQEFTVRPFQLNEETASNPSEFSITFIHNGIRYRYELALVPKRIIYERLHVYKAFKPTLMFERNYDVKSGQYEYSYPGLKGQKKAWEGATRENMLFLSVAVHFNSDDLRPIYDWFSTKLAIFNEHEQINVGFTVAMLNDQESKHKVLDFLHSADISIDDIELVKQRVQRKTIKHDVATGITDVQSDEVDEPTLRFIHKTNSGRATFNIEDESSGTRNLLFLAGPILHMLQNSITLVVDELDTSLHTQLVRAIVRLFHRPDVNNSGAQLIFTTHDTSLLNATGLFRRDQVWFIEKKVDQSSELYGLLEYTPRKSEALERGYLQGRYGALPIMSGVMEPMH